ncbi:MAG: hypothetical protein ACRDRG_18400 [Pseudonocardiaceae bacterium]
MTDRRQSSDAVDAALTHHIEAEGRMAAALVELENHPGHRLLSMATPTGQTAQRWASARDILAGLWQDFGTYQAGVTAARAVRARRARPGDRELAELRRLLMEPSVEVARTLVALPARRLTGAAEQVETITLEQLSVRMDAAFGDVSEVVVTCDALHQAFLIGLPPLAERVQALRELAGDLVPEDSDSVAATVTRLAVRIADLGRACATDPLSLAGRPAAEVLAALDAEIAAVSAQLAGIAAVRDGWDDRLAELAATLQEIDTLRRQEEQARLRAQELIADTGLTAPPDRLIVLRSQLTAATRLEGWPARAAALAELRAAVTDAASELRAARDRATGLHDRREELRGRFEAYRAKAVRLGRAEHPDALALDKNLRQLLWNRPCDLATATRTLAAYQRLVQPVGGNGAGTTV